MIMGILIVAAMVLASACDSGDDDDDANDDIDDDDEIDDDDAGDDDDDDTGDPYADPGQAGPFLVGNTSFFFEDESRRLSCGSGNRILMTEAWYPAVDEAADGWEENYITDFFLDRLDEIQAALQDAGIDPEDELFDLPTGSYRDAPLHDQASSMPLLVFSHGFSSNRFQNYTMATYLASHGYLVVSADHICNAAVTLTPDDVVLFSWVNALFTLFERKADLSFLIDVFTLNPPQMFEGRIDNERVGFWGHSFGGLSVTEQVKSEPRVAGMVQLASFGLPNVPDDLSVASMYMWGRQDSVMRPFMTFHDQLIERMPEPKFEYEFIDTGHFAFSDLCEYSPHLAAEGNGCGTEERIDGPGMFTNPDHGQMHRVLNGYATAFFGSVFFGLPDCADYMAVNQWPERMEIP